VAKHRKVFRFRIRPTKDQEHDLDRMAGTRRYVWNWGLARKHEHYKATGENLSTAALSTELTTLKHQPGTAWLKEADSQALQQTLKDLDRAFRNFFEKRAKYPKFKSRKRDMPRFRIPQRVKVEGEFIIIPKVGKVRIYKSMEIDLPTKSATFKRDALGHWYVTLTAEFEMPDGALPAIDPSKTVGIDVGLIDYATFSDDTPPIPAPKFFRKGQRKLKRAQRKLCRGRFGSNRRKDAKDRVARIHQKIKDQRGDFQHKLTTKIIDRHDAVFTEDLNLRGLVRTKHGRGKSFSDAAFGEFFRQIDYKADWNRKHSLKVDRFYPSSKTCNACGQINATLTLKDRIFVCECGVVIARDKNAALNLRDEGLRTVAVGHPETKNARGVRIRPARAGIGR
jgi:putative transposase